MHLQKNQDGRISLLAVTREERDLLAKLKNYLRGDLEYRQEAGLLIVGPETVIDDLSRAVLIHVCRDGTVTWRTREKPVFNGAALPVYSVDTHEEARQLAVLACSRMTGHHPELPGQPWYRLNDFSGEVEELMGVTRQLRELHARLRLPRG